MRIVARARGSKPKDTDTFRRTDKIDFLVSSPIPLIDFVNTFAQRATIGTGCMAALEMKPATSANPC